MNQEANQLSQLLTQEINLADNLLNLMQQEKNAIEVGLLEKLQTITSKKAESLDQIEVIARKRAQLLLALSSEASTAARMNQFIAQQPSPALETLTSLVAKLEQSLEKCRHQNSVNGMVISMSQRNVQRNLNIIKGVDHESMTYTQNGQTTSVGSKHGSLKV